MSAKQGLPAQAARRLKWPLRLTFAGLFAERVGRAFWPLWSVVLVVLAALMLGLQDTLPLEVVWTCAVLALVGGLAAFWIGARRFKMPRHGEAVERLDATLPGRPIAAVSDVQAIGAGDAASEAVWNAHLERMAKRLDAARAAKADLNLAPRDPFALRYVALLAFAVALVFGSIFRVATVTEIATGGGPTLATGPSWEGWVEPPLYTGQPSLYLNDIDKATFEAPAGSRVTVRFYGEVGALTLHETVSERTEGIPPVTDPVQSFDVMADGVIRIEGTGGREWQIDAIEDMPPSIEFDGTIARGDGGTMEAPFVASDDHGVTSGRMEISLDLTEVDRRFGLTVDPEARETIVLDLPMTISGDRTDFAETVIDDFSQHPWANLPISAELFAFDAAGQEGLAAPQFATLPGRRFFDPMAKAIIEQRRDLLWNRSNGPRVAQVLRAVSYKPDDIFRSEGVYLKLRFALRRLEAAFDAGLSDEIVTETAEVLWDIALEIEEGDLSDAQERLRRAQDRLSEAIENGATDDEIAELMQELREAMQDYMQQLAEQNQGQEQQQAQGEMQELSQQDLQDMLDRLQELMEQGRMAEAQQLMEQLRQMMENMQVTQGQQGQGQQSPGDQAMEGLAETLREQQGLSDEAFRDLQEQFAPEGQEGQSQNNTGRSGSQGQGQQHSPGGNGEPQPGEQQGGGQQQGQQQQQQGGQPGQRQEGALADRQQALRQELNRQMQNMPGAGTPEGDAARESLGRAGEAMDNAEEALREDDFAGALDNQSQAMEALREGMRELADQMAQQQGEPGQQQGEQQGQNQGGGNRDPLGRDLGENGRIGTDENLLQGEDVYRRARELLDEIRKRSGEQERPTEELDYLKRLLDRF